MTPQERAERITPMGKICNVHTPEGLEDHRLAIAAEIEEAVREARTAFGEELSKGCFQYTSANYNQDYSLAKTIVDRKEAEIRKQCYEDAAKIAEEESITDFGIRIDQTDLKDSIAKRIRARAKELK